MRLKSTFLRPWMPESNPIGYISTHPFTSFNVTFQYRSLKLKAIFKLQDELLISFPSGTLRVTSPPTQSPVWHQHMTEITRENKSGFYCVKLHLKCTKCIKMRWFPVCMCNKCAARIFRADRRLSSNLFYQPQHQADLYNISFAVIE